MPNIHEPWVIFQEKKLNWCYTIGQWYLFFLKLFWCSVHKSRNALDSEMHILSYTISTGKKDTEQHGTSEYIITSQPFCKLHHTPFSSITR